MVQRWTMTAGVAAVLGAAALHLYLARFEAEVVGGAPQSVVMVTRDLALGETITEAALSVRDVPEQYVEERHIVASDLSRVVGTRATAAVPSGASLLWSDLDVMQAGRTLSTLVRTGMRAFSLSEGAASFDGLLRPGDRVDVLFVSHDEQREVTATTLLQNVLVLTVGADLGSAGADGEGERDGDGVTLSVTQAQAEQLATTEGRGRLRLSLRNPEDLLINAPVGVATVAGEAATQEVGRAR